jgi:hypothetical protein
MIDLFNKLLARFQLKIVSTKPDTRLVDETVKFLNRTEYSGGLCGVHDVDITKEIPHDYYVGEVTFVTDKTGKTYFRHNFRMEKKGDKYHCDNNGRDNYFCEYSGDPNDPWKKMYEETRFTTEQLEEKLKK